ncbi:hypothetical protein QBC32DRAFT_35144 [Pseudoneurospora amorphoporcata]|uniref:Secreted protein n=1 Tax=Pseudoneurospora amorphoporcata TaxID=241081 RepID=A0AAN6NP94_9PEZI|nr:hypothetical protein QBC32DRAFT_35144 [Pseudoneurospora amorphoporcata]
MRTASTICSLSSFRVLFPGLCEGTGVMMDTAGVHRITACETYKIAAESPGSRPSWISTTVGQTVLRQGGTNSFEDARLPDCCGEDKG